MGFFDFFRRKKGSDNTSYLIPTITAGTDDSHPQEGDGSDGGSAGTADGGAGDGGGGDGGS